MSLNTQRLRLMGLPVFNNAQELADLIHIEASLLREIRSHSHRYYRKYTIKKRDGGRRPIRQPSKTLKGIQAWILWHILDKLTPSPYATAYIRGRRLLSNVTPHRNNRYFVCMDIEDFFPSISRNRITTLFELLGYSRKVAMLLSGLCTCSRNLPEGAVTSPALSNLAVAKLDRRLAGYTSRRNVTYTRYSDDLTFSSNNYVVLSKSIAMCLQIVRSEHFRPHKVRAFGPRQRCLITGLVKNSSASQFGIGTRKKREMRAIMLRLVRGKKVDAKYSTQESIEGWLSYVKSVDQISYDQMNRYWSKICNERGKTT